MTSARSCGLGSLAAIVVPGKTLVGSVRKASSVCSSHVMPDAVIALEYLAPATVPAGRPKTLDRCGPTLFCSVTAWHELQRLNSVLPLPASPSAAAYGRKQSQQHYRRSPFQYFHHGCLLR